MEKRRAEGAGCGRPEKNMPTDGLQGSSLSSLFLGKMRAWVVGFRAGLWGSGCTWLVGVTAGSHFSNQDTEG